MRFLVILASLPLRLKKRNSPNSFQTKSWLLDRPLSMPMKTPMAQIPAETWSDLRKWEQPAAPGLPGL